jgi:MYXO-CTERM domain-containing protein
LSINPSTGAITGTPPRTLLAGSESLSITIQDAQNRTANATFNVAIKAAPSLSTELLPAELLPITNEGPNLLNSIINLNPNGNIIKQSLLNPINFFGTTFNEIFISTNGFITFTEPTGPLGTNTSLISPLFPPFSIALFWDNLKFNSNSKISISNSIINTSADGPVSNETSDLLVVTFSNMQVAGQPNSSLTGQIAINPATGDTSLNYANSGQDWTGATATAGIKGPSADFVIDPFNAGAFLGAPPVNNGTFSAPPEVILSTSSLLSATGLIPYTFTMAAVGGTAPYVWSMDGGPAWLSLNPTSGILSGTPPISTGGATETITFTVLDSNNSTATKTLALTINAGVAPVLPPAPDSGSQCSMVAGGHSGGISMIFGLLVLVAGGLWIRRRTVA